MDEVEAFEAERARLTRIAGFEWGSGYTVNPTPPEEAALFLKRANAERDP